MPPMPSTGLGFLFGGLCMIFALIGLAITLSKSSDCFRFVIPLSILLDVLFIISGDIINKYFVCNRQFLILIPFMAFLTAAGIEKAVRYFTRNAHKQLITYYAGLLLAISIFSIASIPVLSQYYRTKKSIHWQWLIGSPPIGKTAKPFTWTLAMKLLLILFTFNGGDLQKTMKANHENIRIAFSV